MLVIHDFALQTFASTSTRRRASRSPGAKDVGVEILHVEVVLDGGWRIAFVVATTDGAALRG